MLVVDAGCLVEVLAATRRAAAVRQRFVEDDELAAPHIIEAEVLGVIRRFRLSGDLDPTAADQAVEDLRDWPGERFGHRSLLDRAWELRETVRTWDGLYVALSEALGATLLTTDERLARAAGPRCRIEVVR